LVFRTEGLTRVRFQKGEFEDTNEVHRIRKSKTDNKMANRKRTKGQTPIYKTQHRK